MKQGDPATFRTQDSWVRMRLRSILRRNQGKRGRGRGSDHQRWPNVFFAERGLFSRRAPMRRFVSPVGGEPPTGEPCAGEPHARFGGGRDREYNRFFLPL